MNTHYNSTTAQIDSFLALLNLVKDSVKANQENLSESKGRCSWEDNNRCDDPKANFKLRIVGGTDSFPIDAIAPDTVAPIAPDPLSSIVPKHVDPIEPVVLPESGTSKIFLDALTPEYQTLSQLQARLNLSRFIVEKRMGDVEREYPDLVECKVTMPRSWRLRLGGSDVGQPTKPGRSDSSVSNHSACKSKSATDAPVEGNGQPKFTDVRDLVAALAVPPRRYPPVFQYEDCFEAMRKIADGSIDLILVDPPYGKFQSCLDPRIDIDHFIRECLRILTPNGNIVLFGDDDLIHRLRSGADKIRSGLHKQDVIWMKDNATGHNQANGRHLISHETIAHFSKGGTVVRAHIRNTFNPLGSKLISALDKGHARSGVHGDRPKREPRAYLKRVNCPYAVLYCPKDNKGETIHPFQKPLALLEYLVETFSNPGDIVFDPFAGSGSTLIAAYNRGRKSLGFERDKDTFDRASIRITDAQRAIDDQSA